MIALAWSALAWAWPAWLLPSPLLAFGLGWFLWEWADWRNDLYILTPDRIIDIERRPLGLSESRREGGLDRIQDVEIVLPTFFATVFNTGSVVIKTAAAGGDFTFRDVADPRGVQRDIFRYLARYRRQQDLQQRQRQFDDMTQWFGIYSQLVGRPTHPQGGGEEPARRDSDGAA